MKVNRRTQILFVAFLCLIAVFYGAKQVRAYDVIKAPTLRMKGNYEVDANFIKGDEKAGIEADLDHYYKLVIPSDGVVEFRVMNYTDSINFWIYNEDLSYAYADGGCSHKISGGTSTSPYTGTFTQVFSSGTYYLELKCGSGGRYRLYSKYTSYGVTDYGAKSYDSPFKYTLGTQITGALIPHDDEEDWYKFTAPSKGKYTINFTNYSESGSMSLSIKNYDVSQELYSKSVSGMREGAPGVLKEQIELNKGTYYLKVSGSAGKYKTYIRNDNLKKKLKCKITAKRNKKKIVIKTTPGAKVTLKYGGVTYRNKVANSKGKVTIKLRKKLKRGKKFTVTITKTGYSKIKKKITIK